MRVDHLDFLRASQAVQYRALFYVFDGGSGIGHLRRLSLIAECMQKQISCLIVTGHGIAAHMIVPKSCEYLRLPSWDNLIPDKSAYWGRVPFVDVSLDEAVTLRRSILEGVMLGFRPHALFVDHLPLGTASELAPILRTANCRKYLVTRGIQNETEDLERLVFGGEALESLRRDYDRIFSAIDPKVFDFARSYGLPGEVADKVVSVGYVARPNDPQVRKETRAARGLDQSARWVVASAGGGQWGEPLIEASLALAERQSDLYFDIVIGPRSRLCQPDGVETLAGGRVRLHGYCLNLSALNGAADLVITSGGYNTLLEAAQGQARIVCIPSRKDPRDEPYQHAMLLSRYFDLEVETDVTRLPALLDKALYDLDLSSSVPARKGWRELDLGGSERIAQIVYQDLEIAYPLTCNNSADKKMGGGV